MVCLTIAKFHTQVSSIYLEDMQHMRGFKFFEGREDMQTINFLIIIIIWDNSRFQVPTPASHTLIFGKMLTTFPAALTPAQSCSAEHNFLSPNSSSL